MLAIINFVLYFLVAVVFIIAFSMLYDWITPYDSFSLIKKNNLSAVISFGGALLGFTIPLASVISHSAHIFDVLCWGLVAMLVQVLVYFLILKFFPELKKHVEDNNIAGSLYLSFCSIAFGIINAACMSY